MPFETDFSCTYREFRKTSWARLFVTFKSYWFIFLIAFIGIFFMTLGRILEGTSQFIIADLLSPLMILLVFCISMEIGIKMVFEKNKTADRVNTHYVFYNDGFQMSTPSVTNSIRYDALNRIYENKDYFFLKISSRVLMVQKCNCSPELISFLQEKAANFRGRR